MTTFTEIYQRLIQQTLEQDGSTDNMPDDFDQDQLDCLLHPEKHAPIWRIADCDCTHLDQAKCIGSCLFNALTLETDGIKINKELCVGCEVCLVACPNKKLVSSKDIIPTLKSLLNNEKLSYALVAPAFLGQFSPDVTPGKLRSALKVMGFDGVIEVSLFADILTLKEALEFIQNIKTKDDYQLTSCCCPIWIAMIRKIYQELIPHVPAAVSPMIAAGRTVKKLHPDCLTVFIGPCIAKKAEAKEADVSDAIDYVLTFQEIQDVFSAMNIDPSLMEEDEKDHSSRVGRIYAYTGGVSEAVKATIDRLSPNNMIKIKSEQADGVPACKALIQKILSGDITANFYEGMGCVGGCVGGPKAIIDKEAGKANVVTYGAQALYPTPIDNPYVIEMLHQLGFDNVDDLLHDSALLTRHF